MYKGVECPARPGIYLISPDDKKVVNFDVLPGLKDRDSFRKRRTSATENVYCRIEITIMNRTAITTDPFSYSKVGDTFRPRMWHRSTIRADLGSEAFVDFLKPGTMLNSLVCQLGTEGRPSNIVNRFRHAGLGKGQHIDSSNDNVVKVANDRTCLNMQEIVPAIGDFGVNRLNPFLLARPLGYRERRSGLPIELWGRDGAAITHLRQILQSQIDPYTTQRRADWCFADLQHDVEKPVPSPVAREIAAIKNLSFGERSRIEDAERTAGEAECITCTFQFAPFQGNPAQGIPTAISKVRLARLGARFGILLTNIVDGAGVQTQFATTSRGQPDQVEACVPSTAESQRILLSFIAVVPDVINRPSLFVKQAGQGLYAVSENHFHSCSTKNGHASSTLCTDSPLLIRAAFLNPRP